MSRYLCSLSINKMSLSICYFRRNYAYPCFVIFSLQLTGYWSFFYLPPASIFLKTLADSRCIQVSHSSYSKVC
jgi:hypothetical protein